MISDYANILTKGDEASVELLQGVELDSIEDSTAPPHITDSNECRVMELEKLKEHYRTLLFTYVPHGLNVKGESSYKRWGFINFFIQGDREIIAGRQPVPIMNRIYTDQQALHQVCRIVHLSGTIDARNHATSPSPDS